MTEGRRRARFLLKTRHQLRILGELLVEHLDSNRAAELLVASSVNRGHATLAQPPFDDIAAGENISDCSQARPSSSDWREALTMSRHMPVRVTPRLSVGFQRLSHWAFV